VLGSEFIGINTMIFRQSWLLSILIYLSVNGNVFAVPMHLCQAMAAHSVSVMSKAEPLKIHDHHPQPLHQTNGHHSAENSHTMNMSMDMENCSCVDCDCTASVVGQITTSLLTRVDLTTYVPSHGIDYSTHPITFISQPHTTPLRPPIFA
jgi:hypothetical protein